MSQNEILLLTETNAFKANNTAQLITLLANTCSTSTTFNHSTTPLIIACTLKVTFSTEPFGCCNLVFLRHCYEASTNPSAQTLISSNRTLMVMTSLLLCNVKPLPPMGYNLHFSWHNKRLLSGFFPIKL